MRRMILCSLDYIFFLRLFEILPWHDIKYYIYVLSKLRWKQLVSTWSCLLCSLDAISVSWHAGITCDWRVLMVLPDMPAACKRLSLTWKTLFIHDWQAIYLWRAQRTVWWDLIFLVNDTYLCHAMFEYFHVYQCIFEHSCSALCHKSWIFDHQLWNHFLNGSRFLRWWGQCSPNMTLQGPSSIFFY